MPSDRKAAIQAYKDRKPQRGVFAMRCRITGGVWVDSAMDLRAAENRMWFALKLGDIHCDKSIVEEFQRHGRDAFTFEILEQLDEDVIPMAVRDLLKEKKLAWMQKLSARSISPV